MQLWGCFQLLLQGSSYKTTAECCSRRLRNHTTTKSTLTAHQKTDYKCRVLLYQIEQTLPFVHKYKMHIYCRVDIHFISNSSSLHTTAMPLAKIVPYLMINPGANFAFCQSFPENCATVCGEHDVVVFSNVCVTNVTIYNSNPSWEPKRNHPPLLFAALFFFIVVVNCFCVV